MIYLFTKEGCPKCHHIEEHADMSGVDVFNIDTANGLGELAWYELVGVAETSLPILQVGGITISDIDEMCDVLKCERYQEECQDNKCKIGG